MTAIHCWRSDLTRLPPEVLAILPRWLRCRFPGISGWRRFRRLLRRCRIEHSPELFLQGLGLEFWSGMLLLVRPDRLDERPGHLFSRRRARRQRSPRRWRRPGRQLLGSDRKLRWSVLVVSFRGQELALSLPNGCPRQTFLCHTCPRYAATLFGLRMGVHRRSADGRRRRLWPSLCRCGS